MSATAKRIGASEEHLFRRRRRAKRDEDGYFWILGRVDDVLNVAGHRIGTMEVESALWTTRPSPRRRSWVERTS